MSFKAALKKEAKTDTKNTLAVLFTLLRGLASVDFNKSRAPLEPNLSGRLLSHSPTISSPSLASTRFRLAGDQNKKILFLI